MRFTVLLLYLVTTVPYCSVALAIASHSPFRRADKIVIATPQSEEERRFGERGTLAMLEDAIFVGTNKSAYIFKFEGSHWNQTQRIETGVTSSSLTDLHVISAVQDTVLVGTERFSTTLVLEMESPNGWQTIASLQEVQFNNRFGFSSTVGEGYVAVGAPTAHTDVESSGAIYVYEPGPLSQWSSTTTLFPSDRASGDRFGFSMAADKDRLVVGSLLADNDRGAAYVFKRSEDGTWLETAKLTATDLGPFSEFGHSVDLLGNRAIVGATGTGGGAAYIYTTSEAGQWSQVAKLTPSIRNASANFGQSVILTEEYAIVGSPALGPDRQGAVFIFQEQDNGDWKEIQILRPDISAGALFGSALSFSEGLLAVGAPNENDLLLGKYGAVYVFVVPEPGSLYLLLISSAVVFYVRRLSANALGG